jgi:hypothetical protein
MTALAEAVPPAGAAYVVTVGADGRAHVAPIDAVVVEPEGTVVLTGLGRRTSANLAAGSAVTVVWSTGDPEDYTVIVDGSGIVHGSGSGTVEAGRAVVTPERAVLHRRAPHGGTAEDADAGPRCTADCVEVAIR